MFARALKFAACVFALTWAGAAFAEGHPPVEAFGNLPDIVQPKISPDGKHFAAIQAVNGRPAAVIYEVGAPPGTKPTILPASDAVVESIDWVKNDRLVIRLKTNERVVHDNRLRTWMRTVSVKPDGTGTVLLLKDFIFLRNNTEDSYIVDKDLDDPDTIYMPLFVPNMVVKGQFEYHDPYEDLRLDLLKVNAGTGEGHTFAQGLFTSADWVMDGHGHIMARVELTLHPLQQHINVYRGGEWVPSGDYDASEDNNAGVTGLSEDGSALVVQSHRGLPTLSLVRHELATGEEKTVLFSDPNYDISAAIHDEWTGRVIGVTYAADQYEFKYFDDARQTLQTSLEKTFPNMSVHATSMDGSMNRVIVATQNPRTPPTYYFLDRTTHQASKIGTAYPHLTTADLGEMKPYPYAARDGLRIPAYLTLPPGKTPKKLPTIIMPHGGPDARDIMGFDWWAQFLANRGYAVLQPNYRGSSGYGRKFTEAGLHQWGLKMQDDVSDGVKQLIVDGIADPKRICIVGASYGGYAALAGATFTPDLYACAMSFAGVSDLNEFVFQERSDTGQDSQAYSFWVSRVGSDFDDRTKLKATSPDLHADQVKCPILLMHGEGDTTVRIKQSELEYAALKEAGKDVQFIHFAGEDHYLNLGDTRIRMLKELEKFLAQHIGT